MRHVAQQLAAQGRNGDTTLVHMTEGEVKGLRSLARSAGTDLTTNPVTGLPEAFNLMSLLPMAAAFVPGIGPMASMALGAGLGAMTNRGNPLMGAISGGLGAYGGGNLASALTGAGETALASQAATQAAGSAMTAPAADLAAAGVSAGESAVGALPQASAGMGAMENPSLFSSAASNATAGANPADAMRAFEHGYGNTVTGGSGAWDAAMQTAKGAPLGDKLMAGIKSPGDLMTMENAKRIGMPLYGSLTMNPSNTQRGDESGGDNGSEYGGELFYDQRTFVPGLPGGIQRSRAVKKRAQGGLTSLGSFGGGPGGGAVANTARAQMMAPPVMPSGGVAQAPMQSFQPYVSPFASGARKTTQPIQRVDQSKAVAAYEATKQPPAWMGAPPDLRRNNPSFDTQFDTGYAEGGLTGIGQYLRGPGDGMSDDIGATVNDTGEGIRVAANEYVVPADVVSHLGNGSSDAGARVLDAMGARVRKARTGNPAQGRRIDPSRMLPK